MFVLPLVNPFFFTGKVADPLYLFGSRDSRIIKDIKDVVPASRHPLSGCPRWNK